jgi:hypothetical protein
MSLRDWFIAPAPRPDEPDGRPPADARRQVARDPATAWRPPADAAPDTAWQPPANAGDAAPAAFAPPIGAARAGDAAPALFAPPIDTAPAGDAAPAAFAPPIDAAPAGDAAPAAFAPPIGGARAGDAGSVEFAPPIDTAPAGDAAPPIASAVVIGRTGEAEPVAAALALVLRGRNPAAAVVVVADHAEPSAEGGTRAARRLAARLDAHGFAVAARGRLAWAYVEPGAAHRAARIGEPAVLAITVPLTPALELAIQDADLAIVVARDEQGPLAQLATASLTCRTITAKPLARGVARLLARHGVRAPPEARRILRA